METSSPDRPELPDDRRDALSAASEELVVEEDPNLLSQVESFTGNAWVDSQEEVASVGDLQHTEVTAEEIVKEMRHIKRQNTVTHWLLSIMIIVTVGWQLSEVSLILKVKDSLSNPLRAVGNLATGLFKGKAPADTTDGNAEKDTVLPASGQDNNGILPAIPQIKMPELPFKDLTKLPSNNDGD
ncbi:hypothetical protein MLD38_003353 [Melastoma candidum]|uniref:Uncharacterized protein n=1 Tax=Melastoma candidum TaxID=119954 RepID=A0ACB9S5G2_9MYRT|nr:hypothetical protein MLD38_003353 [Melastoma candidum]